MGWQFIDLAELGINTGRSYAAAVLRIILYPLAFTVVLALASALASPALPRSSAPVIAAVLQFGPIVVAGIAVMRSVVQSHQRPWRSLIAADPGIDWRRVAIGGSVELAILAGQFALVYALTGWPLRLAIPAAGLPLAAVTLVLIPLQSASEELLFRGYLTQALGRIARSRVLIAATVGAVFGLLHLDVHGPLTVPYFCVVSLIFSLVSLRDDRLELVIGGHAAMNLFAFAAANTGLAGAVIGGVAEGAVAFNWAAIVVLMVNGALFYGLTRLLVRVFRGPRPAI